MLWHSSHRHDTSAPPLTMAGMIWDGACNFVQAMLHKIERLDKFASVQLKPGGRNAQFCVCASLVWTRLNVWTNLRLCRVKWGEETHNSASVPLSSVLGLISSSVTSGVNHPSVTAQQWSCSREVVGGALIRAPPTAPREQPHCWAVTERWLPDRCSHSWERASKFVNRYCFNNNIITIVYSNKLIFVSNLRNILLYVVIKLCEVVLKSRLDNDIILATRLAAFPRSRLPPYDNH